jgi:proline iminopeptidase
MLITKRGVLAAGLAGALSPTWARAEWASPKATPETADGVRWVTLTSGHRVWTRRLGRGPTKVLLLHGGPGLSHDYMDCFADFLPQAGFEMYFYDQLGCGRSARPDEPSLWTLARYLDEVEEVRSALMIDRMVLVGHSWGGILGLEYALRHPHRLQGFVLSSMTASFADFGAYAEQLKSRLPADVKSQLKTLEREGQSAGQAYDVIIQRELYPQYICRLDPWPDGLTRAFANANTAIYNQMQGPNEFTITGNLRGWDRWADLPEVAVPTLVTGARYDEMNPVSIRREARLIPNARLFMSETGSHLAMWDDRAAYFAAILSFLATLDPGPPGF